MPDWMGGSGGTRMIRTWSLPSSSKEQARQNLPSEGRDSPSEELRVLGAASFWGKWVAPIEGGDGRRGPSGLRGVGWRGSWSMGDASSAGLQTAPWLCLRRSWVRSPRGGATPLSPEFHPWVLLKESGAGFLSYSGYHFLLCTAVTCL